VSKGKANYPQIGALNCYSLPPPIAYVTDCGYMSLTAVFLCRLPTAPPPPPLSYLVSGMLSAAAGGYVAAT